MSTAPAAAVPSPKAAPVPAPPPPPKRMVLTALVRGRQEKPQRILLYGVEGVGKSTFAADAPGAVFADLQDGTSHLNVQRFPRPTTWEELLDIIRTLEAEEHQFGSLVVDPMDMAEALLWRHICARDKKASIEDYGYGKGYQAALDEWRVFLAALDRLSERRKMNVILVAHSWVKAFKNPEGEDFDRYQLKLNDKASGLLKEWCDHVLFGIFETFAHKKDPSSKVEKAKGVSNGARVIYTTRTAAYDAKHRGRMPERLPLSWADFWAALKASGPMEPAKLRAEIERKAALVTDEKAKADALGALQRAGEDGSLLDKLNNWLDAKLAELGAAA